MNFSAKQEVIPEVKPLLKKPQKPKLNKKERLIILLIFVFTLLISGFLYLKEKITQSTQKIVQPFTQPLVITSNPEVKKFDPTSVIEEIKNLTKDLAGYYGVYVYRLSDGQEYGIRQKEIFPAASLMKLPVMVTLYQEAEAGRIDLETKYQLVEADKRGGAGILQSRPAGEVYSYRKLAELMGQYSDNTANNVLAKVLGIKKVQEVIKKIGMEKTNFSEYETTPEDMGIFFRQLYKGKILTNSHKEEIFRFLTKTGFEDRIPAGLPEEAKVVHKVGTEIGVFSDAGIVFPPKREPFVLVIMSKEAKEAEAKEVLPKIAKVIWEFETQN